MKEHQYNNNQLYYLSNSFLFQLKKDIKEELKRRKKENLLEKSRNIIDNLNVKNFKLNSERQKAVYDFNTKQLASLYKFEELYTIREKYFIFLINQDWSSVYPMDIDKGSYYVYAHVDPSKRKFVTTECCGGIYGGEPFYIGKGIGNRAYDFKRNQGHGKVLRNVIKKGYTEKEIVKIAFNGLSEQKAYEIEAKLIYFFGTIYEENRKGILYNLTQPTIPEFIYPMQKSYSDEVFKMKRLKALKLENKK